MSAHTPGPWALVVRGMSSEIEAEDGKKDLATVWYEPDDDDHWNGKLIVAAPAMADALDAALDEADCQCAGRDLEIGGRGHLADCWQAKARAALRAAGRL